MRIIFATSIATPPYSPGRVLHRMGYIQGLQRLGHEVILVEQLKSDQCVNPHGHVVDYESSENRRLFIKLVKDYRLEGRACQFVKESQQTTGLSRGALLQTSAEADLLINWSGHLDDEALMGRVARRAYMDQDPVYTQLWHHQYKCRLNLEQHDVFLSAGINIGRSHSAIPDCGVKWHPVLPPLLLEDQWSSAEPSDGNFTTIATLQPFGDVEYQGTWYRSKYHEFQRYATLPQYVAQNFEVRLNWFEQVCEDTPFLRENGWRLSDAGKLTTDNSYRDFISQSRAEIGIAQHAYVKGRSGWFSDRSAHYLASGKPVLMQSTGFERRLPTGQGLITFRDMDEAIAGVEIINRDYHRQCRAAREFAAEYLDYRKALPRMLDACYSSISC